MTEISPQYQTGPVAYHNILLTNANNAWGTTGVTLKKTGGQIPPNTSCHQALRTGNKRDQDLKAQMATGSAYTASAIERQQGQESSAGQESLSKTVSILFGRVCFRPVKDSRPRGASKTQLEGSAFHSDKSVCQPEKQKSNLKISSVKQTTLISQDNPSQDVDADTARKTLALGANTRSNTPTYSTPTRK